MRLAGLGLLPLFILLAGPARAADPAPPDTAGPPARLLAPTARSPVLTSSFGEYRPGHYHGGLDFSTGGGTGVPVLAPAAGYVWRVRTSGVGYGRALYFRLDDGRTALFGHLESFAPRIESFAEAGQDRLGRYEVDLYPPVDSLRFAAGEMLARSGQSGAGPPHLHAELRAGPEASVAVNPLLGAWSVPDTVAPSLTRIRVEPAEAGVRVNGGVDPVVLVLSAASPPPVTVDGPVRMWVETLDRVSADHGRLAPHRVRWEVDGRPVAEVVLDRVDWNWPQEAEWTWNEALARSENERWLALDPPPGGRQRVFHALDGAGSVTAGLAPGEHVLAVEASDLAGHRTARKLLLRMERRPAAGTPVRGEPVTATFLRSRGPFLLWKVAGAAPESLRVEGSGPGSARSGDYWSVSPAPGGAVLELERPAGDRPGLRRFTLTGAGAPRTEPAAWVEGAGSGAKGKPVRIETDGLRLTVPPEAVYGSLWITVRRGTEAPRRSSELEPVSPDVALGPGAWPLREPVTVSLDPPAGTGRTGLGLYRREGSGWSFVGADTSGPGVAGTVANLETLALFRDTTPPRVTLRTPTARAGWRLVAGVGDAGAGVTWRTLEMRLDGKPVVAEWEPGERGPGEGGRFTAHLRARVPSGEHRWTVEAADRVGNRTERSLTFVVP